MDGGGQQDLPLSGSDDESSQPKENVDISEQCVNPRVQRNILERKRKERIKMYISQLKDMIPADHLPTSKKPLSNNTVLETAVRYMKHLKQQTELFLNGRGSEVQVEEIRRLKKELAEVKRERDSYEKMVSSAAAVTPALIAQVSGKDKRKSAELPLNNKPEAAVPLPQIVASASNKLPGQGLIITQSGQAYYVNEQGIPVAQGIAPPQLLAKSLISSQSSTEVTASSPANTVTPSLPQAVSSTNIVNGLVAVPGHTGQLPSAIILPNGQVIPVVSSNSQTYNSGQLTSTSSVTSSSVISTASNMSELTTTSSIPSNIMLLGNQPVLSNIVMNPNQNSLTVDSSNQIGRKIMPKPSHVITHIAQPVVAPVPSLTPLPLPTCTVNSVPATTDITVETSKKKRTRKKKTKNVEHSAENDILAEATASLFSPQQKISPVGERSESSSENLPPANPEQQHIASDSLLQPSVSSVESSHENQSTKKGSNKKNKLQHNDVPNILSQPPKKSRFTKNKNKSSSEDAKVTGTTPSIQEPTTSNAIIFDPNDLDMVLDQVESIATNEQGDKSLSPTVNETNYQVLNEGEEIGPVFSSLKESDNSPKISTSKNDEALHQSKVPSYASSESYLIGNLTKSAEPVDHRRQGRLQVTNSKMVDVSDAYSVSNPPDSESQSNSKLKSQLSSKTDSSSITNCNISVTTSTATDFKSNQNTYNLSESSVEVEPKTTGSANSASEKNLNHWKHTELKLSTYPSRDFSNSILQQSDLKADTHSSLSEKREDHQLAMPSKPIVAERTTKTQEIKSKSLGSAVTNNPPAWSPARETEWTTLRSTNQDMVKSNSSVIDTPSNTSVIHPPIITHASDHSNQSTNDNRLYSYKQFTPHYNIPNATTNARRHSNESPNTPSYWNEQSAYQQTSSGQNFHPATQQAHLQSSEATVQNLTSSAGEHNQALIQRITSRRNSGAINEFERPGPPVSKSHSFSTESLLSKSVEVTDKTKHKASTPGNMFLPHASIESRSLYDKDKNFMSSHTSNAPYNVNLFSSPCQSLSAFKSHGANSYPQSLAGDQSFSFSLTKSSDSHSVHSSMPSQGRPNNNYSHQQLPFYISQPNAQEIFNSQSVINGEDPAADASSSNRPQQREQLYRNNNRQPIAGKSKKAKTLSQQQSTLPSVPYKIPHAPYLPSFQGSRNEQPTATPDLFVPSTFHKTVNQSFGLPFQSSSFHGLPAHSTSFHQPPHINSSPRFNINNIIKDSGTNDPFKFPPSSHPSAMYSPRSQIYPMSINNILGNGPPSLDMNRPSPTMAGFNGAHPGLGFHHSFEFPLSDQ